MRFLYNLIINDIKTLRFRFLILLISVITIIIIISVLDIDNSISGNTITFFDDFSNKPSIKRIAAIISPINAVLSIMYVYLLTQGRGSAYIYGLISSITYAYIAFSLDYIGEFVVSLIYIPLFIYGFYRWKHHKSFKVILLRSGKTKFLSPKNYFFISIILTILTIGWLFIIPEISKSMIGYYAYQNSLGQWTIDALTNSFNIVGMILMIYGFRNQYDMWLLVNILSIIMYIWIMIDGQYFALSLVIIFLLYLVATIYGIKSWYFAKLEEKDITIEKLKLNNSLQVFNKL